MEIMVDARRVEIEETKVDNLEEILLKIMTEKIGPNKIITAVRLNGQSFSEKNPHDAQGILKNEVQKLEIDTMTPEEMAWHFLIRSGEELNLLIESGERVSELFRIADENEANEYYAAFLESLRSFWRMMNEIKEVLNLDLAAIPFQEGTIENRIQSLAALIDQMLKVQEDGDWVMLADLLEYELIPLLGEWRSILILLKERKEN